MPEELTDPILNYDPTRRQAELLEILILLILECFPALPPAAVLRVKTRLKESRDNAHTARPFKLPSE